MRRFLCVVVALSITATTLAVPVGQDPYLTKTFRTNNGYGVASIAGVTSRNGRVTSISGVNIFPSGTNPFHFPMTAQGRSVDIPEPISFSKEENGKVTTGQIKYGPGSVSVTSVARSVFPEDSTKTKSASFKPVQSTFSSNMFKPNDMIFQDPFSAFNARSLNPWFPNTLMFRQPSFQGYNSMRSGWPYSNNSPLFNFW